MQPRRASSRPVAFCSAPREPDRCGRAPKLEVRRAWQRPEPSPPPPPDACSDAVSALTYLGFSPKESRAAVVAGSAHVDSGAELQVLIREALRCCGKPGS